MADSLGFEPRSAYVVGTAMHRFDKQALLSVSRPGFARSRAIRFQEVDAAGIIFYPVVLEYCHDVYVEFLAVHATPLAEVLRERSWAAPIRHAEADYLMPLRFGDHVDVCLALAHLERSEVTLGYRVLFHQSAKVAAVAQTVHTFVALPQFKRTDIPDQLARAFQTLHS